MIYAWDLAGLFCPRKMPQDPCQTLLPAVVCSKDKETEAVSGPVFPVETAPISVAHVVSQLCIHYVPQKVLVL